MIKQTTTVIALISAGSILTAAYGCSSSTSGGTSNDAGLEGDSGVVTTVLDSGTGATKDSSTGATKDSSTGASDDSGNPVSDDGGAEAAATCPQDVPSSDIPTYAATTATPGACTADQITAFVAACFGTTGTQAGCQTFLTATANAGCTACAVPGYLQKAFVTAGPQLVNPTTHDPLLNTPGCIAQEDSTQTACATDYANLIQCEDVACYTCSDEQTQGPEYTACADPNNIAPSCTTYATSFNTDCTSTADEADGGVYEECGDPTFVTTLYCGGSGDGGAGDAGDGG